MTEFILNDQHIVSDLHPGTTVLDFIRYERDLKGTKIGCREGDCGACTVLVGDLSGGTLRYRSMTSCLMAIGNAHGKHIVTVEGINSDELTPVQQSVVEEGGTQCGFCTVGFVMSLTGFCLDDKNPVPAGSVAAIDGNICRCTGYKSLQRACKKIEAMLPASNSSNYLKSLVAQKFVPEYFGTIESRLKKIQPADRKNQNGNLVLGGGTDLYVQKHDTMIAGALSFYFDDPVLKFIREENDSIVLGGSVTVSDIRESKLMNKYFPGLQQHLKLVSSTPIRNMATIAGNFVNASPIGDMTIYFLALDALVSLKDNSKQRTIRLRDFYKGYKQLDKSPDEYIESIRFKKPAQGSLFNFEKVSKRTHLDIASVNSAAYFRLDKQNITEAHASIGGVFAFPKYLEKTCSYLTGKEISDELFISAVKILQEEISPISDARGTADYKRLLARQLFLAHATSCFPEKINLKKMLAVA